MTASFLQAVKSRGFNAVLSDFYSNSKTTLKKLRDSLYTWLKANDFVQKLDVSYEGLLPVNTPILNAFTAGS